MLLWRYLRTYRFILSVTILLSGASAAITVGILAHIQSLVANSFAMETVAPLVYGTIWLVALLITSGLSQYLSARLGAHLVSRLRTELSQQIIAATYENLVHRKHVVFGAFIEDIAHIAPLVLIAPLIAYNALLVIACSMYLLSLSLPLFFILIAGLSLPLTISWLLFWKARSQFDILRQSEEQVFEYLRAISEGKKEMILNRARAQHFTKELLQPAIACTQERMSRVHLTMGLSQAWSSWMIYASIFTTVYLGQVILASPTNTVMPFVVGSFFLIGPLMYLIEVGQHAGTGLASLRHLEHLGLNLQSEAPPIRPVQRTAFVHADWCHIRAENLSYSFPSDASGTSQNIGPISLDIRRGELIFIVGNNGSGKSTLLLLLCGLLSPKSGSLIIDGCPVHNDLSAYQNLFSGVFSDFFLFQHVLTAKGICPPDEQIAAHVRQLGLERQIQVRNGKLSRLTLSTGQRKRLALVQCFAENRDIVVFDEWAADQDPKFREYFYQTLLPEFKANGKTVLVVSHDDRYFQLADRLIELDEGLVVSDIGPSTKVH